MPFDAGSRPNKSTPSEPDDLPIDWIDWAMRIVVFGMVMVLWLVWAGTSIWNAIVQGLGLS